MHYERLTALDASFVDIEDVNVHRHVAAALLFDPGPLRHPEGGLEMEHAVVQLGDEREAALAAGARGRVDPARGNG